MLDMLAIASYLGFLRYGGWLQSKEEDVRPSIEPSKRNYDFIDYYRKSYELETDPEQKELYFHQVLEREAFRDYHTESLRQINNLLQIDREPNLELTEPKEELYKISVSFWPKRK